MATHTTFLIVDIVTTIIIVSDQKYIMHFILLSIPGQCIPSKRSFPVTARYLRGKVYKIRSEMSGC